MDGTVEGGALWVGRPEVADLKYELRSTDACSKVACKLLMYNVVEEDFS